MNYFRENKFAQKVLAISRNPFLRQGLPLVILVVGGSFGLIIVQRIKIDHKREQQTTEHLRLKGRNFNKPVSLEEEYAKLQKIDTSSYENVRGPRPYEDNSEWEAKKAAQEKRFQEALEYIRKGG